MCGRVSNIEIRRRVAALLKTPRAGRAVAGQLQDQTDDWATRAAIGDLRARRLEALRQGADTDTARPIDAKPGSGKLQ